MKKNEASNEIDLVEIFKTLWYNKIKVVLIVALTVAFASNYQINRADKIIINYKFSTKINAISIFDEMKYQNFNNILLNYPNLKKIIASVGTGPEYQTIDSEINKYFLFDFFVMVFKEEKERLVEEFNFIKKEDYEDELAYRRKINEIASLINIIKIKENKSTKSRSIQGIIEFQTQDINVKNKWIDFVYTLEDNINKSLQKYLKESLNTEIEILKLIKKNRVKSIEEKIKTTLKYYELEMNSRLSFLREQAKIAREGNVESEKVTPSSFGSNYSINYNEDGLLSLYYLKGYRVIEKEIELINNRSNPYLYAKDIPGLEIRKFEMESDQSFNNAAAEIKKTPIFNDDKFIATRIQKLTSAEQIGDRYLSMSKMIIFGVLIGFIIAIFYVYISSILYNAFKRNHK